MLKNELLQKAQADIEGQVKNTDVFKRLMSAGMKVVYDRATFPQLLDAVAKAQDPVAEAAKGIVGIMHVLVERSRGTFPKDAGDALLQAGFALLLDALDFMEQAGLIQVDKPTLAKATKDYTEAMLPTIGQTPQNLEQILSRVQQVVNDPQRAQALRQMAVSAP